jgi:ABC-type antimicrobial peptide transport system permease subunit
VASSIFLIIFGEKLGFGIFTVTEKILTASFSKMFLQFIYFADVLIFIVGVVIASFVAFVMMHQRVRDIGLMKAVGCPNDLIFGYFLTELLIIAFLSCLLGVFLGVLVDFVSMGLLSNFGMHIPQTSMDAWLIIQFFLLFFALIVIFGLKPILDATKTEPARAISPTQYFGLTEEPKFKPVPKASIVTIASRSLFRRKSATIRIVLCLTAVFILTTVTIAGGIIANQTTRNWVEKAIGTDMLIIAHNEVCSQYKLLLSKFYENKIIPQFNYADERYFIHENLINQLSLMHENVTIEQRLILQAHAKEIQGYIIGETTGGTRVVGDNREGETVVIGIEPEKVLNQWFHEGKLLENSEAYEALIGDSLAEKMFEMPLNQQIMLFNTNLKIVGFCLDPINNGNISYVPLKTLQNITGISKPNILMAKITSANYTEILNHIKELVKYANSDFEVAELNEILNKNLSFLGFIWSIIMFLPMFSLTSATICLIGYVVLAVTEQKQEFGILRALGAKQKTVLIIMSLQSLTILLSSCAIGIELGTIITLLILIPEPVVTGFTFIQIATWFLSALTIIFVFSLYPATKLIKKPLRELIA